MNPQKSADKALADGEISTETHEAFTKLCAAAEAPTAGVKAVNLTDFLMGLFNWVKDNGALIQQFYPLILALIASLKPKA